MMREVFRGQDQGAKSPSRLKALDILTPDRSDSRGGHCGSRSSIVYARFLQCNGLCVAQKTRGGFSRFYLAGPRGTNGL
jgi:hypothetical protein